MTLTDSFVYCVGGGEADIWGYCRPAALQNFMQDIATRHAARLGMSRGDLPGSAVWVMTGIRYNLTRPLEYLSMVEIATWHRGSVGAHFYRDFAFFLGGRPVGGAVSTWIVYDMDSGRIVRPALIGASGTEYSPPGAKNELLPRMRRPETLILQGTRNVLYSDIDINGHVNNVRYCDFACDALGQLIEKKCFIRSVWIQYTGQTLPGETLSLFSGKTPDGSFFVTGRGEDGKTRFDTVMEVDFD